MNYSQITRLIQEAYSAKSKKEQQELANREWSRVKKNKEAYDALVRRLEAKIERRVKRKANV